MITNNAPTGTGIGVGASITFHATGAIGGITVDVDGETVFDGGTTFDGWDYVATDLGGGTTGYELIPPSRWMPLVQVSVDADDGGGLVSWNFTPGEHTSLTWTQAIATGRFRMRKYFTIQGIPYVFQEDSAEVPTSMEPATRQRLRIIRSIEQGETELDIDLRRQVGGSLRVVLQEEDDTLLALIAPRKFRKTYVRASVDRSGAATMDVAGTTWLEPGVQTAIYVGGETMIVTRLDADTVTINTRGAFDSVAQRHLGEAENGAAVFDVPPAWLGRRVYLYGYLVDKDGLTFPDLRQQLGVFSIGESPKETQDGDDAVEINCTELSDEFFTKKIGGGLQNIDDVTNLRFYARSVALPGSDPREFILDQISDSDIRLLATGDAFTYVVISFQDPVVGFLHVTFVIKIVDVGLNTAVLLYTGDFLDTGWFVATRASNGLSSPTSVKHLALLNDLVYATMQVITSRLGDSTNGAADTLPGRERELTDDIGESEWRMGAGIDVNEVDEESFLSLPYRPSWSYILDDEADLGDFLYEVSLDTGSASLVGRDGKLRQKSIREEDGTSVLDIDDDIIVPGSVRVQYMEGSIFPRVRLESNYDPIEGKYLVRTSWYDAEMQARYPNREDSLELRSKSILIDGLPMSRWMDSYRPRIGQDELRNRMRQIQVANVRGRAHLSCRCSFAVFVASVGDLVTVTTRARDLEGTRAIAGRSGRIVSMRPHYDRNEIDVVIQLFDKLYRVAPAAMISSSGGGGTILTLQTTGPEVPHAFPGRMFVDGWDVDVVDDSTGTVVRRTIASHTDTTLTVDSDIGFAIEAGKDWVRTVAQANLTDNEDGYDQTDFLYMAAADESAVGVVDPSTRWR